MRGVDDELPDVAGETQLDDDEVMSAVPPSPRLPSLAHRSRVVGAIEHAGGGVEIVAAGGHDAAVSLACQIYGQLLKAAWVGYHLAEHAQPGDAAVGIGGEPYVGEPTRVRHTEHVVRVTAQRRPRHQLRPAGFRT